MKISGLWMLVGLVVAGCGAPQPEKSKESGSNTPQAKASVDDPKKLFPFAEGNRWIYSVEITRQLPGRPRQSTTGEIEYRVLKVSESNGLTRAVLAVFQDGSKKDEQEWGVDKNGLYQLTVGKNKAVYSPKQTVIKFPVKDQEEYKWNGTGMTPIGKSGSMKYSFKQDGMLAADTDAGTMTCVYMQSGGTFQNNDGSKGQIGVNSWFAPGVGLARYRQVVSVKEGESAITLRLKSYTVK